MIRLKFELSERQYNLIREALENYWEICGEGGEYRHLTGEIEALAEGLHEQYVKEYYSENKRERKINERRRS